MFAANLRSMFAHKLRLVLTTSAIALGVAFLAGTLILTDTTKVAFTQLFTKVAAGSDAVVRAKAPFQQSAGVELSRGPVDAKLVDLVARVDGVRAAEGTVSGYALLTDTHGRAITTKGGAPTAGYSLPTDKKLRGEVTIRSGRSPTGPHEVAIDATSAEQHHIPLGSTIKILFRGPTREFTVVGTVGFGKAKNLGGTTGAYFDTPTAVDVLGTKGTYDAISVSAVPGVTPAELARRIDATLPAGVEAVTGATVAKESSDAITKNMAMVSMVFGMFAGIALFVGAFIIWNTFSMIVAQRSREIALVRAMGATRRQVRRDLLGEALLLGGGASALGVALGVGVAKALTALMDALGFVLPSTSMQIEGRTVWASLAVGVLVTVVAALVPTRRATKVLPVEAMRASTYDVKRSSRLRAAFGAALTGGGLASVIVGLSAKNGVKPMLLGAVAVVFGVLVLAPLTARPLAKVIGVPLHLRGLPGDLARQNVVRNPRRTAATASALMIGLTLVVGMGVFAASTKASFPAVLAQSTNADLYLTTASEQADGYSPEATKAVAAVPGVKLVSATSFGMARIAGSETQYSSVDPATADRALNLDVSAGSLHALGGNGVVVKHSVANRHHWKLGDTIPSEFAQSGRHDLRIVGIYDRYTGVINSDYILGLPTQQAYAGDVLHTTAGIQLASGVDPRSATARIKAALADHPDAVVLDSKQFEQRISGSIDALLTFVSVMLLLAVVIALLGIVNTMALAVFERTRELGLLRAVGATRGQVRSMVRWESVVISLIGALSGTALGIGLGIVLSQSMKGQGITEIAVPGGQVAIYLILAGLAGVLAAIAPARSAARVDVLRAVVSD